MATGQVLDDDVRTVVERAFEVACRVSDELRPDLLASFGSARADLKRDGTLVTKADVSSNERIVAAVTEVFPDHEVLSEELDRRYHGGEWCWVVDPIDGTTNFVRGTPTWCVSIALAWRGEPVLALIDAPALGLRYHAVRGEGAYLDGAALTVEDADWDDPLAVENALVGLSSGVGRYYFVDTPLKPRVLGSAALHLASVAQGAMVGAILTGTRVWDVAAGALLVTEAGGVLVEVTGDPPFPMRPGVDHDRVVHRFVAAASHRTAREIIRGFERR